ncbi:MAG: alpha/beta hydrolase fold domain-containing protein [Clostridia bacterium]|nr:alpha/beta hydrolase fold domain-containing protein [Clostridia bacterium]
MLKTDYKAIVPDISVIYKNVNGLELPLRIYLPKGFSKKKKYTAVICIHGGGWTTGIKDNELWNGGDMSAHSAYYAAKGFVGVSFSYRSVALDGVDLRDIIEDCNDAVRFIAENYRFIDRKIVMGDSAGGYLAVNLAMAEDETIRPDFVVACNPVLQLKEKFLYAASNNKNLAEKLNLLSRKSKKCSNILFVHGCSDKVVDVRDSIRLSQRLNLEGFNSEIELLEETDHAFILFDYIYDNNKVLEFLLLIDKYIEEAIL